MNISSRCEYACRAVIELAQHSGEEPLTATAIAERRNIPEKYLVHILLQLKRAGIVKSVRGAQGGYHLAKPADSVSLRDVVTAVDGPILDPLPVGGEGSEELALAWANVSDDVGKVLQRTTFQAILERASRTDMYYI